MTAPPKSICRNDIVSVFIDSENSFIGIVMDGNLLEARKDEIRQLSEHPEFISFFTTDILQTNLQAVMYTISLRDTKDGGFQVISIGTGKSKVNVYVLPEQYDQAKRYLEEKYPSMLEFHIVDGYDAPPISLPPNTGADVSAFGFILILAAVGAALAMKKR